MKLQNIKVSECYESETNPRGKDFEGVAFVELVASVREKGVLVPVLARPREKGAKQFEIVAGNRRFRAAQKAGLTEIPASVQELSDVEAREAQIVENLQRADIHPIEEGEAYRRLIEQGKNYDLGAVAAKVGKSVSYVRNRLVLTDLTPTAKKAYRDGKITPGHAPLIARLETAEQEKALKYVDRMEPTTDELRSWIQAERVKSLVAAPPWKDHDKLVHAAAPCAECDKKKGGDLFGKGAAEQCGDPVCFARRMAAHIELTKREFAEKQIPLTLASSEYSSSKQDVLGSGHYSELEGKEKCKSEHKALIVEGEENVGRIIRICTDENCPSHGERRPGTPYKQTVAEKAARKRQLAAEKRKKMAEITARANALKKVKWPMTERTLDMLLHLALSRGTMVTRPVANRRNIAPKVSQHWYDSSHKQGYKNTDYERPLRDVAKTMKPEEKAQLLIELVLSDHSYSQKSLIDRL